jgi:hypothetical protein
VLMMDAGRQQKRAEAGIDVQTHIPGWVLPKTMDGARKKRLQKTMKPDILIHSEGKESEPGTIRLVEVKYCQDTDKTKQQSKADHQHTGLIKLMTEAGFKVIQHTILLGAGGTIYKELEDQLEDLGVAKPRATKLMERLSIYAVEQLQHIIRTRRALEKQQQQSAGTWKKWGPRRDPWARTVRAATTTKRKRGVG